MQLPIEELTISEFHSSLRSKQITSKELVEEYLFRIKNIDENGPKLNSTITVNDKVIQEAEMLDEFFNRKGELIGPLHGVPIAV